MTKEFALLGLTEERGWFPIAVSESEDYIKEVYEFEHESLFTLKNPTRRYLALKIDSYDKDLMLKFEHARYMMDQGHIVRMAVNPEKYYRLSRDHVTYVSRDIITGSPDEWQNAVFFTSHLIGDWVICNKEMVQ